MTIEKLQKIATSISDAKYKARWLRWWNSSEDARRAYRFPMPKDKDNTWDPWIKQGFILGGGTFLRYSNSSTFDCKIWTAHSCNMIH